MKITCKDCGKTWDDGMGELLEGTGLEFIAELPSDTNLCPTCLEKRDAEPIITLGNGMEVKIARVDWIEDGYKHPIIFGKSWDYRSIEIMDIEIKDMIPGLAKTAAEGALCLIKEAYRKANK